MAVGPVGNYGVRVRQYTSENPQNYFFSNYEVTVLSAVDFLEIDSFCDVLQNFHSLLQRPDIYSDKVSFFTWFPDSSPYNADEVHSYENTVQGTYNPTLAGDKAPLEICLKLKRSVETGISGNIGLRGALYQGDYRGSGSTMIATNVSAQRLRVLQASEDSTLNGYFRASESPIKFAMLGVNEDNEQTFRLVTGFSFQKIGSINVTKRYFDKPA